MLIFDLRNRRGGPARPRRRQTFSNLREVPALLLLAGVACGGSPSSGAVPAPATTTTAAPTPTSVAIPAGIRLTYDLHMNFFSAEVKAPKVIDPQMFARAPGASAGTGPQNIDHAANLAPVALEAPDDTALYDATGQAVGVTLGQWKAAKGQSTVSCGGGAETVRSTFTNLLTTGAYSLFVVHFKVTGQGRFTPAGASDGSGDLVTPAAGGSASHATSFSPCLGPTDALVLIWNSDGRSHGASPGTIGITQHNHLIVRAPTL